MSMWVSVDVGYIVQATTGAHVLLKDGFIPYLQCPGIEDHILHLPAFPENLRTNLPAQHAYVCENIVQNSSFGNFFCR